MKRVTGLGGVFIKCKNREAMMEWYKKHLHIPLEDWGVVFDPKEFKESHPSAYHVFSLNDDTSKYYEPSASPFMLNFTVANLDELWPILQSEGVNVVNKSEANEYGKFAWILDPEGNKIELWEPPHHESQ